MNTNEKSVPMTAKERALKHIEEKTKGNGFVPVLLSQTWGNAEKLIWYTTLDHRGEYWLVLVDSTMDLSASGEFGSIAENEISTAIEEEFGTVYDDECEHPYPALSYHGCSWGVLKL
jgi:hypothetical protein